MREMEQSLDSAVGSFQFEVFKAGRNNGRSCCSRFKVCCDAVGIHEKEVLLLSIVGPETSIKSLTAGFRSSSKDQKRYEYSVQLGDLQETQLTKSPDGYRVYRTKLGYDLWHVLLLSKREGFLTIVTEQNHLAVFPEPPIHHASFAGMDSLVVSGDEKA